MCIIAIKPRGEKMFSRDQLYTMFRSNPDGAGLMYYDEELKTVVIEKGFMTFDNLMTYLSAHNFTSTSVILHFRIGTSGAFNKLNCHPNPVYGKNSIRCFTSLGMAHNGILKGFEPRKREGVNDTQVFIREYIRTLEKNFLKHRYTKERIKKKIGTNKLAFLDDKGKITLIGDFIHDGKYIYSNRSYLPGDKKVSAHFNDFDWYDYMETDYDTFMNQYFKGGKNV